MYVCIALYHHCIFSYAHMFMIASLCSHHLGRISCHVSTYTSYYLPYIMGIALLSTTLDHFLCDHPEPWRSPRAPGRNGLCQKRDFADRFFQYNLYYKNVTFIAPDRLPWISPDSGRRVPMDTFYGQAHSGPPAGIHFLQGR